MNWFEFANRYSGGYTMSLKEFLEEHGDHEILECIDAVHNSPLDLDEIRERVGGKAEVEYLGKESAHYLDNDGLYFVIRPLDKDGLPQDDEGLDVVVYVT